MAQPSRQREPGWGIAVRMPGRSTLRPRAAWGLVLALLRGLVDDAEYLRLRSRQQHWREEQEAGPSLRWSGDLRGRFEQFWFGSGPSGVEGSDRRSRLRYRLRLRGEARVLPTLRAVFRLASGEGSSRSANRTLGVGEDFDPDAVFLDQAFLEWRPREGGLPGRSGLRFGKMPVPFRWSHSPDSMLWDRDLQVEGVSASWEPNPAGAWQPYLRAAYLIADENARHRDPHLLGLQLGIDVEASADWLLGGRVAQYLWGSLDERFLDRAARNGNLRGGLGDPSVTEVAGYLRWSGSESWPVELYGHVLRNHNARRSSLQPGAGREGMGYGIGLRAGDRRRVAQIGVGWFRMEANAWPAQLIDSPLLGGRANREALTLHVLRELRAHTDLKLTLFVGEPIHEGAAFLPALAGSDRVLLQTDLLVRF